jgi:hypothetical protein
MHPCGRIKEATKNNQRKKSIMLKNQTEAQQQGAANRY